MKTLIILLALSLAACELPKEETAQAITAPEPSKGQFNLADLTFQTGDNINFTSNEFNSEEPFVAPSEDYTSRLPKNNLGTDSLYIKDGAAHPTLFGDQIQITGNTYKWVRWKDSKHMLEEGTIETNTISHIEFNAEGDKFIIHAKRIITRQPLNMLPNDCNSFDSYETEYYLNKDAESAPSMNEHRMFIDSEMYIKSTPGWPFDIDYGEGFAPECF